MQASSITYLWKTQPQFKLLCCQVWSQDEGCYLSPSFKVMANKRLAVAGNITAYPLLNARVIDRSYSSQDLTLLSCTQFGHHFPSQVLVWAKEDGVQYFNRCRSEMQYNAIVCNIQ